MTLLQRYEVKRGGTVYTVELMKEDAPHPTRKNYYAYVSDSAEKVARTRNVQTDAMAKRAAENTVTNWFVRRTVQSTGRGGVPVAEIVAILRAMPGCGVIDISASLGKPTGTLAKWLARMVRDGAIRCEETGAGTRTRKAWFACEGAAS